MKTIAFICDLEEGHFLPTFALAHELKRRGHDIWYVSTVENQEIIEGQAFQFYCLFDKLYPVGTTEKIKRGLLLPGEEEQQEAKARQNRHMECLIKEDIYGAMLREIKADMVLISF